MRAPLSASQWRGAGGEVLYDAGRQHDGRWTAEQAHAWQPADGNWRAFGVRLLVLNIGLMLFAFALVLGYRSGLGLNAWNIFQIALTKYIPITPGQMSIAVGGIMILVAWRAGIPPALATVCNMVFVGLWFDFFAARIPEADRFVVALPMLIGGRRA